MRIIKMTNENLIKAREIDRLISRATEAIQIVDNDKDSKRLKDTIFELKQDLAKIPVGCFKLNAEKLPTGFIRCGSYNPNTKKTHLCKDCQEIKQIKENNL